MFATLYAYHRRSWQEKYLSSKNILLNRVFLPTAFSEINLVCQKVMYVERAIHLRFLFNICVYQS